MTSRTSPSLRLPGATIPRQPRTGGGRRPRRPRAAGRGRAPPSRAADKRVAPLPWAPAMANDQREVRLQKLAALRAAGVRPYADRFPTTHTLDAARRAAEGGDGVPVRIAGRVMTARAFGKLTFAHLQDASGRCQVALDASVVGEEALERFDRLVDLGDFVGFEGSTFRTKKGEP